MDKSTQSQDSQSEQEKQQERQLKLLEQLEHLEPFRVWREQVCLPILSQLKADLRDPIKYSEADLKAKVMYLNLVEDLFYELFEQIKATK